jgi:hypothetical protein
MLMLYADQPARRFRTAAGDAAVLLWTAAWITAGVVVDRLALSLQRLSDGLTEAGRNLDQLIESFRSAAPSGLPVVGQFFQQLATSLERVSGRQLIAWGTQAHDDIARFGLALALFVALPPILLVAGRHVRRRWADARELGSAAEFLAAARARGHAETATAVLAQRAVVTLSFRELMRASRDPAGDLEAGRHRELSAALLDSIGLRSDRLFA